MIKKIKSLLFGLLLVQFAFGQFKNYTKQEKKLFLDAESFYQYGDYLTALNMLDPLKEKSENFSEYNFIYGASNYHLKNYPVAVPFLEKGVEFNNDANFILAAIALYNQDLDRAEAYIGDYKTAYDVKKNTYSESDIDRLKGNIKTAKELMYNPEVVNIINLGKGINSENAEYGPLISSDETVLIYTSRRISDDNGMDPTGQPFENIYMSQRDSTGTNWKEAELISGKVNTPKHDAAVGLSAGGDVLYIYRSNENLVGGDLYESKFMDDKWTTPIRMSENINNLQTIEPSASVSLDGKTFYFSSNREGGYGGFDIYRVVMLPTGEWSLPMNLGPIINTKYDDDGPFIHPDGKTLYFSSQGHRNMGGFDIFKTTLKDTSWSVPENLGSPTNTTKDDVYFVISANEQHGYYSSDKKGGFGKQDLYMIDYLEKSLRSSVIRGQVVDQDGNPLSADISVIRLEDAELSGVYVTNPKNGKFIFLVNPNVEYEVLIETKNVPETFEEVNYSVEDLRKSQSIKFTVK